MLWVKGGRTPELTLIPGSFHSDKLPSGYYDVENSEGNPIQGFPLTPPGEESARAALPPEEGPAAPDRTDYDDVGEESPGEGGAL
ncbi:scavenger receptor cysteine-rich type 1 protein M130-like [Huso huso]|uniref:Scavenger receptor cysteine-rich type 1 protein M130-like n=1 Tax=Huso huso TaxID=61971 RepID=A0ABR0YBX6_HUSHU